MKSITKIAANRGQFRLSTIALSVALATIAISPTIAHAQAVTLGGGTVSSASDPSQIAIGSNATTTGPSETAIGYGATVNDTAGLAFGYNATVNGIGGLAVGYSAIAAQDAMALGYNANASGLQSLSFGFQSAASGSDAIAVGSESSATGTQSTALGVDAQSSGAGSVALGAGSTDSGLANVVSVGNSVTQRRIINVAAGINSSDAATMGQLSSVAASLGGGAGYSSTTGAWTAPIFTVPTVSGSTSYGTVSAALAGIGTRVTTLENEYTTLSSASSGSGSSSSGSGSSTSTTTTTTTDSVTQEQLTTAMQQVNSSQSTTNQAVSQLANTLGQDMNQVEGQINNLSQRIDGVGAMSAAMGSNMFNPADTHDTQLGVGVGTYRGQFGYSVGAFHRFAPNMVANLKVSGATGAAGVAFGGGMTVGF